MFSDFVYIHLKIGTLIKSTSTEYLLAKYREMEKAQAGRDGYTTIWEHLHTRQIPGTSLTLLPHNGLLNNKHKISINLKTPTTSFPVIKR